MVATVIDSLSSTSTTDALSAKQGQILNQTKIKLGDKVSLSNPLTSTNLSYYSYDISRAKAIIAFFTFNTNKYRDTVIIQYGDTEWAQVNYSDGQVGYINVNWTGGTINVSQYSSTNFKVLAYSLIM